MPPRQDGSKQPDVSAWKKYQTERVQLADIEFLYRQAHRTGFGVLTGPVSGHRGADGTPIDALILFEFDDYAAFEAFLLAAAAVGLGELVDRVRGGYEEVTPGGGIHWLLYCTAFGGNTKLARRLKRPEEQADQHDTVKTMIETRESAGYAVLAPSNGRVHPSGRQYQIVTGGIDLVVTITPAERADLYALARSFDEMPPKEGTESAGHTSKQGGRPGDDFNARASWADVLEPAGWTHVSTRGDVGYWRRPGKDCGISATTNHGRSDLLFVFSTSTEFEAERGYNKFSAYALLTRHGDFRAAARELRRLGYGATKPALAAAGAPGPGDRSAITKEEARELTVTLALAVCAKSSFAVDAGRVLYRYDGGTYVADGERFVRARVKRLLLQWELGDRWSANRATEVATFLADDAPELWECPPLDRVCVLNGIIDLSGREPKLLPHTPAHLTSVQLPVNFNPTATCPFWDAFIDATFPEDARSVAYQLPAWLMRPDTSLQKAVLLVGEGSNGKSVLLAGLTAFLGRRNVSAVGLHQMAADRFATAGLVGRLANIVADLPTSHLSSTAVFKAVTGGDSIQAEYKFKNTFTFVPFARLIFSANALPTASDATSAFFRRWLVIPFSRTFEPGAPDAVPRDILDARLAHPDELSGLLNRALASIPHVVAHGLSEPASLREAATEFREATDPLSIWFERTICAKLDGTISKYLILDTYNADGRSVGRSPMTANAFTRAVRRRYPQVQERQVTVLGRHIWVWVGIAWRESQSSEPWADGFGFMDEAGGTRPEKVGIESGFQRENPAINPDNPNFPLTVLPLGAMGVKGEIDWHEEEAQGKGTKSRNKVGIVGNPGTAGPSGLPRPPLPADTLLLTRADWISTLPAGVPTVLPAEPDDLSDSPLAQYASDVMQRRQAYLEHPPETPKTPRKPRPPGRTAAERRRAGELVTSPAPPSSASARDPMAVHYSSKSVEWYTPPHIVERVVQALGSIDLDPCSNSHEAPNVPATTHFTIDDDGLRRPWAGRIFMNSPYGKGPRGIAGWVSKLAGEYAAGRVTAAIALVPAKSDTGWWRVLASFPHCLVRGRLKFSGSLNAAPFPSALFYLGDDFEAFAAAFADVGGIYAGAVTRSETAP